VETPGVQRFGDPANAGATERANTQKRLRQHPLEPTEGGEEEVETPGADRPGNRQVPLRDRSLESTR
jgi:hypothetical protein